MEQGSERERDRTRESERERAENKIKKVNSSVSGPWISGLADVMSMRLSEVKDNISAANLPPNEWFTWDHPPAPPLGRWIQKISPRIHHITGC